jgi:hypothetical protein
MRHSDNMTKEETRTGNMNCVKNPIILVILQTVLW